MFTSDERDRLRSTLLEQATKDQRISGAAITGSRAAAREDRWSDVDLALGVQDAAELPNVLSDWTARMYEQHLAVHHFDVPRGEWIYRVFFLASTLQVDLALVSAAEFRATAPTFQLMFGKANEPRHNPPPQPGDIIGLAWLYAIHARSGIAREKLWQAEYMISACMQSVHGKSTRGVLEEIVPAVTLLILGENFCHAGPREEAENFLSRRCWPVSLNPPLFELFSEAG